MNISEVCARINAVENRHHRIILSFCTIGYENWNIEALKVKLDEMLPASLSYLSSNLKTFESQYRFPATDDMRLYIREALLTASFPGPKYEAAENEDMWCDSLIDAVVSSHGIRIDYPRLVHAKFVDAYTRFTFTVMCSDVSGDQLQTEHSGSPCEGVVISRRIKNLAVIELISERPDDWERIASLFLDGVDTRAAICAVLDGEVAPALAKGVL